MHLSQYVWAFVLAAVGLGLLVPGPGLLIKPYISYLLILLMTLSLLNITLTDIKNAFTHRRVYLVVALTLLTPLLAWTAKPFLDPLSFAGLVLATAVPAGVSIVFICTLCKGNPADALSITSLSHVLSIITVPLLLLLLVGQAVPIDITAIITSLLTFILIPLILAQLARPLLKQYQPIVLPLSTTSLVLIIWGIVAPTRAHILSDIHAFLALSGIAVACMLAAFCIGWLIGKTKRNRITYSISASYKNYTLATVIALSVFGEVAALAAVSYTIFNNVLFALAQYLGRR